MTWTIGATVADKIGFASHQNAVPVLREARIGNGTDGTVEGLRLVLSADPAFVSPKTWLIDRLSPGDDLQITDRDVTLNASFLRELTECIRGTVSLTLFAANGDELVVSRHPVELLAHNEWGGLGSMAELLPAFVMPNDPAVDRVLKAASDVLRRAGKADGLDGYSSGKRERIWELTSAIWSAIAGLRISYALPPASFERSGQKIRTPGAILEGGVATCLDTALLFAAALEQAGLNPMIVMTSGHAFAGVWLQPVEFANLLTDEAAALRRRFDLDDLLLFETTLATHTPPAGFSQAMAAARRQIDEGAEAKFEMAIDVRRARMQRVRPLGVAVGDRGPQDAKSISISEALESAPALPAFDVEIDQEADTPGDRIRQWQRKLLNLTTGNRLLHVPDSAKVLKLMCPDPGALEDILSSGRKVRVVPMPDLDSGGRDERLYEQQTQTNLREEVAKAALARGEALSLLGRDKLDALLIELFRKAKTDLEEGGANTLYLGLGFLKWKKSANEEKAYRAPLILLPVRLERKSALSGVVMTRHEDEPRFNLTLLELLRQDFELAIPGLDGELPTDESGVDVPGVWRTVRAAVRDIPGFEVVPDVVLGTFSFAKYLMWKDLVDRADRLKDSPLVRHLIERDGGVMENNGAFPRPEDLDVEMDPSSLFTPLPADSSQIAAVVASAKGFDFVLDGPPGTGKSQTIANMIAHNLALGRRVLFVAEKKAALDVVHRRLSDKGLAPFCLELHSAKATKAAVLKQLDRAWSTRDALTAEEWAGEASEARRLRDGLNDVVRLLHRVEPNGWTLHRAIGRTVRDANEATPKFTFDGQRNHDLAAMSGLRDVARRLGIARVEVTGLPADLDGVARTEWSNGWQEAIVAVATRLPNVLDALLAAQGTLRKATGLPIEASDRAGLGRLASFSRTLLEMHGRDFRFAFAPDVADRVAAAREGVRLIEEYRRQEQQLSTSYAPEASGRVDVDATRAAWTLAEGKFWFFATIAKRRVARDLAKAGGASEPLDVEADLPRLEMMRDLLGRIDTATTRAVGIPGWAGLGSDAAEVERSISLGEHLRAAIAAEAESPEMLIDLRRAVSGLVLDANELLAPDGGVAGCVSRLESAVEDFDAAADSFNQLASADATAALKTLRLRALAVAANARRLHAWTGWRRVRDEAVRACLVPLVAALENESIAPGDALTMFEVGYARWFASTRIDEEPLLTHFMAGEQEDRIARFRQVDDRMGELSVRYIRAKLCGLIPDRAEVGKKDGYGILKRQLQLQRAHKPIRQLAADMGDAFTRLAPCMLMSPLSIAQYLPTDQALFDLVIFDEASQITPWDAIGAMARGRQVVIAGDPRQMPPSNDFARGASSVSSDDDTEMDMDSILDECLGAGVPQHSLDWHYRSKHESLITFSNHRYYESKLVTFPAPVTRSSAVSWQKVDGVYARGAGRTNPIEAQAIVDYAVAKLRDPTFVDARGVKLTIGIITMNAEQMKLTEDLLDKARRSHPVIEPYFSDEMLEPVVVRNLETAQGDERDLILLGIGFGPTEPGGKSMSMDFGKLNREGGWRRLNVAVTRARVEMKVFTSFDPGMIDLARTSQRAIADLKHFIEFADRGPRALAEAVRGSVGGADSPFEEAVAWALQRRGWNVVPQVGVSRFRIDLGVVHPDRPGDFFLGVECDGATYHSAATARDRDKVRASILESLGWKLARVWSTDWWIDKERATEKLHRQIERHLEEDRAATEESKRAAEEAASSELDLVIDDVPCPTTGLGGDEDAATPPTSHTPESVGRRFGVLTADYARPVDVLLPIAEPLFAAAASIAPEVYSVVELSLENATIDPTAFYDPSYDVVLAALVAQVLAAEGPIAEPLLVQRIARAHGFQRSGRIVRDRVMSIAERDFHVAKDPLGLTFVWHTISAQEGWASARAPRTERDIRQIEEIAMEELRAAGPGLDAATVARHFGIRRLTATARARLERANVAK
jgi:very-short-patch-repair endonuclease